MDTLHHIAIPAADVAASVRWYLEHTDCTVEYQDETWALLEYANIKLALVTPGQHPPHFGLVREDAASYGPLVLHRDGSKSVYIRDPAGNAIEVLDARSL